MREFGSIAVATFLALLLLTPLSAKAESVTRLLGDAEEALVSADLEPEPLARLALLQSALASLDRIVNEHLENPLAAQIRSGGWVIGTTRPQLIARIAKLRARPDACFPDPDADCLTLIAMGFAGKLAFLRDRVGAEIQIAESLAARDDQDGVASALERALKAATGIKASASRARSLVRLADAQRRMGFRESAAHNLSAALGALDELAPGQDQGGIMTQIAAGFVALQENDRALEALIAAADGVATVTSPNARVEVLARLARLFQAAGDSAAAQRLAQAAGETLDGMGDAYDRAWGRLLTARALADLDQTDLASTLVDRAVAAAQSLPSARIRASLMTEAADVVAGWGDAERAETLLATLFADSLSLENTAERRNILLWLARGRLAIGDREGAREALDLALAEALQGHEASPLSPLVFSNIGVALHDAGDLDGAEIALDLAKEAVIQTSDADRLLDVSIALARSARGPEAAALLTDTWRAGGYRTAKDAKRLGLGPLLEVAAAIDPESTGRHLRQVTPHN